MWSDIHNFRIVILLVLLYLDIYLFYLKNKESITSFKLKVYLKFFDKIGCFIVLSSIIVFTIIGVLYNFTNNKLLVEIWEFFISDFTKHMYDVEIDLNFSVYFTSIIIGLYYFYYREQKQISDTLIFRNNLKLEHILGIIILMFMGIIAGNIKNPCSLFDGIAIISYVFWTFVFIKYIFEHMNVMILIRESVNDIKIAFNLLYNPNVLWETHSGIVWNFILWKTETVYQLIYYAINKKIQILYKETLSLLMETIKITMRFYEKALCEGEIKENRELMMEYYRCILRNHKKVCLELYEMRYEGAYNNSIKLMECMNLCNIKETHKNTYYKLVMQNEYLKILYSLCIYMIKNNQGNFHVMMLKLMNVERNRENFWSIIAVFRAMLIEAINTDNIQLLIETCQYQKIFTDSISNGIVKKIADDNEFEAMFNYRNEQKNSKEFYEEIMLYIIVKTILKATELSKYKYVGFLIKYIVTMYNGSKIRRIIMALLKNDFVDKKMQNAKMCNLLLVNFNFNRETLVYCLNKTVLLIAIQSRYVKKNDFKFSLKEYIEKMPCDDALKKHASLKWKYYLDKIIDTKSSYGLLCLKDDKIKIQRAIIESFGEDIFGED